MGPPERVDGPNEYAGNRTCYSVIGFGAKIPPNGTGSKLVSFASLRRTGFGRVDPDGLRERRGPRWFADETLGVPLEGRGQGPLALIQDLTGRAGRLAWRWSPGPASWPVPRFRDGPPSDRPRSG